MKYKNNINLNKDLNDFYEKENENRKRLYNHLLNLKILNITAILVCILYIAIDMSDIKMINMMVDRELFINSIIFYTSLLFLIETVYLIINFCFHMNFSINYLLIRKNNIISIKKTLKNNHNKNRRRNHKFKRNKFKV